MASTLEIFDALDDTFVGELEILRHVFNFNDFPQLISPLLCSR